MTAAAPAIIEQLRSLPEKVGSIQEYRVGSKYTRHPPLLVFLDLY